MCRLRIEADFFAIDAGQMVGMIFEEILLPELIPMLQKVVQEYHIQNKSHIETASNCILQAMVLSVDSPHSDQVTERLAQLLRLLCGQQSGSVQVSLSQLSQRNAIMISKSIKYFLENFEELQNYWTDLFSLCSWVIELNDTCIRLMQSFDSQLPHSSVVALSDLFTVTPLEEVQSVFQLKSLIKTIDQACDLLQSFFGTFF